MFNLVDLMLNISFLFEYQRLNKPFDGILDSLFLFKHRHCLLVKGFPYKASLDYFNKTSKAILFDTIFYNMQSSKQGEPFLKQRNLGVDEQP